jgi:hypothetical protein
MTHIHWVERQNKLQVPTDKDEVNKWEIEPLVRVKMTMWWGSGHCHGTVPWVSFLKLKQKSESPQRKPRTHVPTQISMRHPPHLNHTQSSHEYDGWSRDPEVTTVPPTPKSTHRSETLVRASSTIVSCHEEDDDLRKWPFPRYCDVRYILETKTKVGITTTKVPDPRTNPKIDETPTTPNTHPSHPEIPHPSTPSSSLMWFIIMNQQSES